jgi:hypothetical protein
MNAPATRRRDLPRLRVIREYQPDRERMLAAVRLALARRIEQEAAAADSFEDEAEAEA